MNDTRITHGICTECKMSTMLKAHIQIKQEAFDREWEAFKKLEVI